MELNELGSVKYTLKTKLKTYIWFVCALNKKITGKKKEVVGDQQDQRRVKGFKMAPVSLH